jgi:hypothetical protein
MHFAIGFSVSLLALTISAAPACQAPSAVEVQFANDITGANSNALIPLDGSSVSLRQAYANTDLFKDGTLFVTSLDFTSNFANVACEVLNTQFTAVASIADPQADFQKFSETPLNWATGFTISCSIP